MSVRRAGAGAPRDVPAVRTRPVVLRNARIGVRGPTTSIRIEHGVVAALGVEEPVAGAEVVDAEGRTVIPGLWDAHVHLTQWASTRRRIDVSAATSAAHAADLVTAASGDDAQDVLFGYGFRDALWNDLPDKALLESALPGRPVLLLSNDLHAVWLSPAALDLIGRPDHPTGVFREDEARAVEDALPRPTDAEVDRWVVEAAAEAARRGVTGLTDFEVADNVGDWVRRFATYDVALRITCTVYPQWLDAAIAAGLRTGDVMTGAGGRLTMGPVKIILDGSLNTRTALCSDPYPGSTADPYGLQLTDTAELEEIMARAAAHGIEPAVHAIGDEANRIALDAFERVGCRGRIEHAQLLRDDDVRRLAELGVVAGVQPSHVPGDRDVADRVWPGRTGRSFRYADLLAAGVRLEIGSDAPVTPLDPWLGIAAAVTRDDPDRGDSWHPEQTIGIDDAVAAACAGRRNLSVGDPADLVLLDADPAGVRHADLTTMPVAATMLGGRWTYGPS